MNKKGGNFFEEHAEKIVLVLVGLVCMWLLATRVLFSPNNVEYQGLKFSCGKIDDQIAKQTDIFRGDLEAAPKPSEEVYESRIDEYKVLLDSSITDVGSKVSWPIPVVFTGDIVKRFYAIPAIPEVNDISIEHIRAAVHMPIEAIDEENPYSSCDTDINDLDFVTVSANIDVAQLYNNFFENFASEQVKEDWRDPCLAVPVFAAVELQRQQKLEDGSWSDWQIVPRTKIDLHKLMFETIENAAELPIGGIGIRLIEYGGLSVQMDVLQPGTYAIASPDEQWLPPELHKEYIERQKKAADRQRKIKMAEDKEERDRVRRERRTERTSNKKTPAGTESGGGYGGGGAKTLVTGGEGATVQREVKERKTRLEILKEAEPITFDDIYDEFDAVLLDENKTIGSLSELVFWSHDDTVALGETYRYRTRVGIFNPTAGTDQFKDEYKSRRNEVVLWSDYSQVSEVVEIPSMLYFYAESITESARTVTVKVYKYNLGYWYTEDFTVRAGELIGKVVERENAERKTEDEVVPPTGSFELPAKVDYSTNAVMVDVVAVKDWGGLRSYSARPHWEMLYTFDALNINRMPISSKYWSAQQRAKHAQLKKLAKQEKKPYLDKSSSKTMRRDTYKPTRNPGTPSTPRGVNPEMQEYRELE